MMTLPSHARGRPQGAAMMFLWMVCLAGVASFARGQVAPQVPPGYVLVDDMILPEEVVFGDANFTATPWPSGIVPFTFDPNVTTTNRNLALTAMAELEAVANVNFVTRTTQQNFIVVTNSNSNSSFVGMIGGSQIVNIASWGTKYIIVHELLHALGYNHEHVRPDRNSFVTVNFANISQTQCNGSCNINFQLDNSATTVGAYDFLSIMHYPGGAFSNNGQNTITCLPAFAQFQNQMGQRTFMTVQDAVGLATRYGGPAAPSVSSISPISVATTTGTFTLIVTGTRFIQGSPNQQGVQGSRILWNGNPIPTTFVSSSRLEATITSSMINYPQNISVRVENPTPGGGFSNSQTFQVTCPVGPHLSLALNTPRPVTTPCTTFSLGAVSNEWNVVGITSTSDWDVNIGPANAWWGSGTCDFALSNGMLGSVIPQFGEFPRFSGTANATAEFTAASTMTIGFPRDTFLPSGSVLRAFRFNVSTAGTFDVTVTGSSSLAWLLYAPGSSAAWRPGAAFLRSGQVAGPPSTGVSLSAGWHCIVVCRNQGVSSVTEPVTVNVCPTASNLVLISSAFSTTLQNPCQPFSMTPIAGSWNAVGVSSLSDWDTTVGTAEAQTGGTVCDFLVANGKLGTVTPTQGLFSRFSGGDPGSAQHSTTTTLAANTSFGATWTTSAVLRVLQFDVSCPSTLDISVTGSSFLRWALFAPGTNAGWRTRADALATGTAGGTGLAAITLQPGWHALVISRDGGGGASGTLGVNIAPSAAPPPVASALVPNTAPRGSSGLTLTVTGSSFRCNSLVRWNGVNLPTTFVSATQLTATVAAGNLASAGNQAVSVFTPTPGGGVSPSLTFAVTNPSPVATALVPSSQTAGSPGFTMAVQGSGFASQSQVRWNGSTLSTTFVSSTQLSATVSASLLLSAGSANVTVFNPAPGGGTSGAQTFTINNPLPVLSTLSPSSQVAGSPALSVTLQGSGFNNASVARWNGAALPVQSQSASQMIVTVPLNLLVTAGTANVTVFNPSPGGGTSVSRTFTVQNPAPVLSILNPSSTTMGGPAFTLAVTGSNFNAQSVVRWNATSLSTTHNSASSLTAQVPSSFIANAGSATVTVFNPSPGGGTSAAFNLPIFNAPAAIASLLPSSAAAGGPGFVLTVNGSGFSAASEVRFGGVAVATSFTSSSVLTATIPANLVATAGTAGVFVVNPPPGGGNSATLVFQILAPVISSVQPHSIAPLGSGQGPVNVTLTGSAFHPGSVVYANGEALPTQVAGATQATCQIDAGLVPQLLLHGGVALNVQNATNTVSNTVALIVGNGNNRGTIRRQPLAPVPGQVYSALVEGGVAGQLLTLLIDLENPTPVPSFPDSNANLVLAVGPLAGSSGQGFLALVDGIGLYGPSQGIQFSAQGTYALPGFAAPNPALGIDLTVQGVYLDPTAPYGFRLTWARYPDRL